MKRAMIEVSRLYLLKLLKVPKKAGIMGVKFDNKHDTIRIYLNNVGKELSECELVEMSAIDDL